MRVFQQLRIYLSLCALILALPSAQVLAQTNASGAKPEPPRAAEGGDGQHDFDFEFGSWQTHLKRLLRPLTGSNDWVEYEGLSVVRKVWDGRANLGELDVHNPTSRIQGMSLRLYNPQSRKWSIY